MPRLMQLCYLNYPYVARNKLSLSAFTHRTSSFQCTGCLSLIARYTNQRFLVTHMELKHVTFSVIDVGLESLGHDVNKSIDQQSCV